MKTISITYTILDTIEVPDNFTDDEIEEACEMHWYDTEMKYNDLEWEEC
jgi:hypothetical protein